jgi:hypothetical protein
MSRSAPTPALAWRYRLASLVACLTLGFLAGGLVIPHGAAEEHSDLPIGTHLDANARHPGQPLHMETADPEVVHGCTACLLQTSTRSILDRPSDVPLPHITASPIVPPLEWSDDAPVRRLAPVRGPPPVLPAP